MAADIAGPMRRFAAEVGAIGRRMGGRVTTTGNGAACTVVAGVPGCLVVNARVGAVVAGGAFNVAGRVVAAFFTMVRVVGRNVGAGVFVGLGVVAAVFTGFIVGAGVVATVWTGFTVGFGVTVTFATVRRVVTTLTFTARSSAVPARS